MDFLIRQHQQDKSLSPLFGCPGFSIACCKIDFLHCSDLGVCSDFIGNVMQYLIDHKIPGPSALERCGHLYREIDAFYKANSVEDRMPCLKPSMLKKTAGSPPKLRAKAAEARSLVPFVVLACEKYLDPADQVELTITQAAMQLNTAYSCLSPSLWNPDHFEAAVHKFALLYQVLEAHVSDNCHWRIKPKLHLLLELARTRVNPSLSWTYRDEGFGGTLALLAKRRGGEFSLLGRSQAMRLKFFASNTVPILHS